MSEVLAYLLTWTCYGTWLQGDDRGSVDDQHRVFGSPFVSANPVYRRYGQAQLRHPPIELDEGQRKIVAETVTAHCRYRRWELLAVNVRSNHVHAVVATGSVPPERVLNELKAWSTRGLREKGHFQSNDQIWTRHGSTRYLWNEASVESAVAYVLDHQDRPRD